MVQKTNQPVVLCPPSTGQAGLLVAERGIIITVVVGLVADCRRHISRYHLVCFCISDPARCCGFAHRPFLELRQRRRQARPHGTVGKAWHIPARGTFFQMVWNGKDV